MFLNELRLKQVRNHRNLNLTMSPQVNIFFGLNAQGKTNLLEAIAILCLGRSFRTKKDQELINWESESCYLSGAFETANGATLIEIGIGAKERRFKVDQQPVKSGAAFGRIPLVSFAPDDLQIIKGGPQYRRDFIDLYLAQIEPKYRFVYYNFYKVLQQRNQILKSEHPNQTELEVWDEQLVEKGAKVIAYRKRLLESVQPFISQAQYEISGASEDLCLEYLCFNNQPLLEDNETAIKDRFQEALLAARHLELERRLTLIGPQRDDLRLSLTGGGELRCFGSQGQQRTAALALKLGLVEKIKESRGEYPLLLLDDVMSEFDNNRKQQLLKLLISSAQTFMTSTSRSDFPITGCATAFFRVERGEVTRVE